MANQVYIIAEAGVNHNGSLTSARRLVKAAADARADAVKFQTFKAERLVSARAPKAAYQMETTNTEETQLEMLKKLELDEKALRVLVQHCHRAGIQFLSTPFDQESLDLLVRRFDLPLIKISSGDVTNAPLLLKAAQTMKPVILSTGMSTLEDIETALGILAFGYTKTGKPSLRRFRSAHGSAAGQKALKRKVILLHCTTDYPAPFEDVHLRAMETMRRAFDLPVGLSDHTTGIAVAIAAVALGACVIEKHFTLDRNLPGPDHIASLEPDQLREMIAAIRQVESAMGSPRKRPSVAELRNSHAVRKSLVAACAIRKGTLFTETNVCLKRPGTGIPPVRYWEELGKKAKRDYGEDELIEP